MHNLRVGTRAIAELDEKLNGHEREKREIAEHGQAVEVAAR